MKKHGIIVFCAVALFLVFVVLAGITSAEEFSQTIHAVDGLSFAMRLAPAAQFPTLPDDSSSAVVQNPFWISETSVTFELWYALQHWARGQGYVFANDGQEGNIGEPGAAPQASNHPVTNINWFDAVIWTNALSAYSGLTPVYVCDDYVLTNATEAAACEIEKATDADGFRLPSSSEWELAARFIGPTNDVEEPLRSEALFMDGFYWTPGYYASGASASLSNQTETKSAAWYHANSSDFTQPVGQKPSSGNALGLYDMSGNVWEWTDTPTGIGRIAAGGCYHVLALDLRIGLLPEGPPPEFAAIFLGFRIARSDVEIRD